MPSAVFTSPRQLVSKYVSSKPLTTKDAVHRTARNRLLPVLRLCSDVLEYLFLVAAAMEHSPASLRRSVMAYSQTCHDWRIIALSSKRLWTRMVDFEDASRSWNEEMLRRSYPLSIQLSYQADFSRGASSLAFQLEQLPRIRTYSLGCQDTDWDVLVSMLTRPAPVLEELYITCYRTFGHNILTTPILPWSLFDGTAPKLRRVEMKECIIDLRSPLLRTLTALRVIDLSYDNAPTASQWVRHLRNMPSLKELYLQGAILPTRFHSSIDKSSDDNPMPLIDNLNIEAPLTDVALLVRNLPKPTKSQWTLTCSNASPGSDLEQVMDVLSSSIISINQHDSAGLAHLLLAARETDIFLRSEMPSTNPQESEPEIGISVSFHTPSFHLWETLFPAVASVLNTIMPKITSLEMILPTINPSLLSLLQRATALTTLVKLSSKMTRDLIPQLQISLPSGEIALPALESIVFTDDKSMWGWNYQSFLGYLRWRAQNKLPIRNVYFVGCLILEEVANELMDLGVTVHGNLEGVRWQNL
ncbi:hypothetical protein CPC08DRAFT_234256 [Agrocybe pediades]|nr:hypothetical protein CPC08DRAFT_234256 [Agrocybe pediades]